jgi:ribosomal RNA-processing protein 12
MVLSDKPSKTESQLVPSWLAVIAAGFDAYAQLDRDDCLKRIPNLLRQIFPFLQAESQTIREALGSALVALAQNCISVETSSEILDEALQAISEIALQGLTTRYQFRWREVFRFIGALFIVLKQNADPLFFDSIKIIESNEGERWI